MTFILATHNRRAVLLHTLGRLLRCGLERDAFEVIVVDNASSDGTPRAVAERFPGVMVMPLADNRGSCAKALAVGRTRGGYVVFLDDDSYPRPGAVGRMIAHFEREERLAAAGFVVHLSGGRMECSAFPNVFIGCGVGLRSSALADVGGLDADLFMQAEEYDLSFRLINAGWRVETFDDLNVDHLKTTKARVGARTTFYDTRNNLLLIDRYLAPPYHAIYRRDWMQRYKWLAVLNNHTRSFARALAAATSLGRLDRRRYAGRRLGPDAFETLFRLEYVRSRMADLRRRGVLRVLLADLGKNIYTFYRGALQTGLSILAIADDRFALVGNDYRGIPLVATDQAADLNADAVIISNTSPVHASATRARLAALVTVPVHLWFAGPPASAGSEFASTCPPVHADEPEPAGHPVG